MYVINPPAIPAGIKTKSSDPGIQAVEYACQLAGVNYDVLDHPVIAEGINDWPEIVHVVLPDLGVHLAVSTAENSLLQERHIKRQMVLDGQQGVDTLVGILASMRKD
ncbi:hypothetical protein [Sphingomonas melonis]|uniref:hypothetical protein n=1 Tax=Sphingomonas melonis TaxID=152682 RepID=UPI00037FB0C2|nr:hypothetical protein [Sphingomonas melonis]